MMVHKRIMTAAAKKLDKDAKKYHKEAAHAKGVKKKHEKVEEKEAKSGAKVMRRMARKAHDY